MQHQHPRTLEASGTYYTGGGSYDGRIAGLYDLEETLGSGHFAVVKMARHVFTGAKVAVKVVDKTKLDEVSRAHLFQEVRCMKLVQHPNVVRLYEVIDTQTKLYLVLELGDGGDLYDYIMRHDRGLNENLARKYFRQILRAITYCHQLHVVHRDLKPENVVFFEKLGVVKLTDFGFSNKFSPGQKLETFCGSLAYSAPEILLGDSYDAPAVDIWSLGVILYMLVCGQPPFEKANDSETLTMIMDCKYTIPSQVSVACHTLIASMLVRDPKKRATLEQIASDPWLRQNMQNDTNDFLPLVSRENIDEEDHSFIIQKMTNGNIATKEEILQALDKDNYNHITATYFLLAEMRLRKRREDSQAKGNFLVPNPKKGNSTKIGVVSNKVKIHSDDNSTVMPINIIRAPDILTMDLKKEKRNRKCSIVCEEDEEESMHNSCENNELKVGATRHESISDSRLNHSIEEPLLNTTCPGNMNMNKDDNSVHTINTHKNPKIIVTVDATDSKIQYNIKDVTDNKSVTDFNSINESTEMHDTLKGLDELKLKSNKNPILVHKRHSKMTRIRTPSCSSSEASDDDTKTRHKKKPHKFIGDTPIRFHMHRRDSYDDSSDSQDQGFQPTTTHGNYDTATIIVPNANNKTHERQQNKANENHKSTHSRGTKKQCKQINDFDVDKNDSLMVQNIQQIQIQSKSFNKCYRRRIRESQSLDRITEAQEYDVRYHNHHSHTPIFNSTNQCTSEQKLFSLQAFPEMKKDIGEADVAKKCNEKKIEDDEQIIAYKIKENNIPVVCENSRKLQICQSFRNYDYNLTKDSIYKLRSIEEFNLILSERNLTKSLQVAGSKCSVTVKKIRKLGKYFPVINFT